MLFYHFKTLMICENRCALKAIGFNALQSIIAMLTEDKVTEIFCTMDDFCKFFDALLTK